MEQPSNTFYYCLFRFDSFQEQKVHLIAFYQSYLKHCSIEYVDDLLLASLNLQLSEQHVRPTSHLVTDAFSMQRELVSKIRYYSRLSISPPLWLQN